MRITHFGHACVLLETGSARLLLDPGVFSSGFEDLRDLDAVLITHLHADHLDLDRLAPLMAANQHAELVVGPGTSAETGKAGLAARTVRLGDALEVAGAALSVVGGEHAVIHPDVEVPANVGFVVDHGAFYHPGDALFVPEQRVDVLGLPVGAPWLKVSEAVDFYRAVAPRAAVAIHERTLSDVGLGLTRNALANLGPDGAMFTVLPQGESTAV